MPLFYYKCGGCELVVKKILSPEEATAGGFKCPKCQSDLVRTPKAPSAQVNEVLDNGLMTKRVERLKDAEELHHERASKNYYKPPP